MKKKIDETKVILVTKEMKKEHPELKNVSMIQLKITKDMTWYEAMKYAKNLKLLGYRNWRLPNIIECRKIIELFKNEMKLDWWYWTNIEYSTSAAYLVGYYGGVDYHDESSSDGCFCVR